MTVEAEIATLTERVNGTRDKIDGVAETTEKIWAVLDGPKGVVTQVSKHDDSIDSLNKTRTWLARLIIGATVSGLIGLVIYNMR